MCTSLEIRRHTYTHIYIYIHTYIHIVPICILIQTYINTDIDINMCIRIYIYMKLACMRACKYVDVQAVNVMCGEMFMYVHVDTHDDLGRAFVECSELGFCPSCRNQGGL